MNSISIVANVSTFTILSKSPFSKFHNLYLLCLHNNQHFQHYFPYSEISSKNCSMFTFTFLKCVALATTLILRHEHVSASAPVGSISMRVVNNAGSPIELYWLNVFDKSLKYPDNLVLQSSKPIRNSSDIQINSYDTHQFVVRYLKHIDGLEVPFTKGPREEIISIGYDELAKKMTVKQTTKFDEIMDTVKKTTKSCNGLRGDDFSTCVATGVLEDVNRLADSKSQLAKYRDMISSKLRNYTCADPEMDTTEPVSTYAYTSRGHEYNIDVLLDTPHAKIWKADDFVTDEECNILIQHGGPRLRRATVAAEDGSSVVSENRKAQQASYDLHQHDPVNDPLMPLFARVLDLTNRQAGFNLRPEGQEDFTIIQYNVADQYTPHCDGTCDGSMHISGGRVATAVIYCKVAEIGGATTFTKSDIFVKPKNGSATFFSYKGSDGRMDEGYTEHSGCPVLEGEKWITTMWMREGVTREEPWTLFDPNGVRLMEETIQEDLASVEANREGSAAVAEECPATGCV